jgi:hypothetical protein
VPQVTDVGIWITSYKEDLQSYVIISLWVSVSGSDVAIDTENRSRKRRVAFHTESNTHTHTHTHTHTAFSDETVIIGSPLPFASHHELLNVGLAG